ncbi:MotA/TolQ/ExbB proton channel family protein [bacterium]|jgi:biopolymer transport protein ExbB|nr:MotA/TolQ/ExbB proton channel family protein [bacterium]
MIFGLFEKGGMVMWPLFGVAVVAFYLIVYKAILLFKLNLDNRKDVGLLDLRDLLRERDFDGSEVLLTMDTGRNRILKKGISYLRKGFQDETIKDRLQMIYDDEVEKLDKGMSLILVLGEIMPMLGLLGTVSGMIQVFKAITAYGTGDAQALASGISEALLTTEVGLVLAIPTMFFYTFLNSKIESQSSLLRQSGATVVTVSRVLQAKDKMASLPEG